MNLPMLPDPDGEDWRDFLSCPTGRNGWRAIHLWGLWGWRLGRWPSKVVCHYDGDGSYAHAALGGGVFTVRSFPRGIFGTTPQIGISSSSTALIKWKGVMHRSICGMAG